MMIVWTQLLTVATVSFQWAVAQHGGQLELLLVRYSNPGNEQKDGSCCDPIIPRLVCGDCDTYLEVCVIDTNSPGSGCRLGEIKTDVLASAEAITFGMEGQTLTSETSIVNPLVFPFSGQWTGSVNIVVKIWDEDFGNDDEVNKVDYFITTSAQANNNNTWSPAVHQCGYHPKSCLTLLYRVLCNTTDTSCDPAVDGNVTDEIGSLQTSFLSGSHIVVKELTDFGQHCSVINSNRSVKWTFHDSKGIFFTLRTELKGHFQSGIQVGNGWMNLTAVTRYAAGQYMCSIDDEGNTTASFVLFVESPPLFTRIIQPPGFEVVTYLEVNASTNISLMCYSEAYPPAVLSWLHNDRPLSQTVSTQYGNPGVSGRIASELPLHLMNVTLAENGTYQCVSDNGILGPQPFLDPVVQIILQDFALPDQTTYPPTTSLMPSTRSTMVTEASAFSSPSRNMSQSATSPMTVTSQGTAILTGNESSSSTLGIVVGVVAGILVIIIIIAIFVYCFRDKDKQKVVITFLAERKSVRERKRNLQNQDSYTNMADTTVHHHVNTAALLMDEEDDLSKSKSTSFRSKTSSLAGSGKFLLRDSPQSSLLRNSSPSPALMMRNADSVLYTPSASQSDSLNRRTSNLLKNSTKGARQADNILYNPSPAATLDVDVGQQRASVVYAEPVLQADQKSKTTDLRTSSEHYQHTYESISSLPKDPEYLEPVFGHGPKPSSAMAGRKPSEPQYTSADPDYQEL